MNDFHITTVEADHIRLHAVINTRCFGAEFPGMKEWCNTIFEGQVVSFFFSSRHIGKKQTDGKEVKRQTGGHAGRQKNK